MNGKMCNAKDLSFTDYMMINCFRLWATRFQISSCYASKIEQETMVPGPGHINYSFFGEALLLWLKISTLIGMNRLKPKIESPKQMSPSLQLLMRRLVG
uniref:Uncharacterized protein n=1 Tax=Ditylenchus dipsaci TaxID=166011 RepID=A0A915EAT5_9BILA